MVLALQTTTLDITTNVEARLKIMNGLSWHLVEDGYLGRGKHYRKWIHLDMPKWYFLHKLLL